MNLTKLEIGLALAVAVLVLLGVFDLVARHQGAQSCINGDKAVVAKQEVHNTQVQAAGTVAGAAEDRNREDALKTPVAPTPTVEAGSVQPPAVPSCPKQLPAARPASAASHAAPPVDVRAAGAPVVVQETWDAFIAADVQRAHDADVEIADRDRLLQQRDAVCRGIAPSVPESLF